MVEAPELGDGPELPAAPGKSKTVQAPGAGLRSDGTLTKAAIEQIVSGGVQAAFMLMAAFTRPPEYQPAWQFSEKEVKPAADHFVRWLQTFQPERLTVMAKYIDPALGAVAMYGLYTVARLRERELESAYAAMVNGAQGGTTGPVADEVRNPREDRRNSKQRNGAPDAEKPTSNLPPNFFS